MRTVAVLCAAKKTAYREIPGVEVYDETRGARTFIGGMPVIAHPPCRRWTTFGLNMLKAADARWPNRVPPTKEEIAVERELGVWCAHQVERLGGVLEQPAGSQLFRAAGIPQPGERRSDRSFSLYVWQRWWGFPTKKGTWLYFSGICESDIHLPFCLHNRGGDGNRFELMPGGNHPYYRSHTVPALANWLVDLARTANINT